MTGKQNSYSRAVGYGAVFIMTAVLALSGTIIFGSTARAANPETQWASPLPKAGASDQPGRRLGAGMRTEAIPSGIAQSLPPELKGLANPSGRNASQGPGNSDPQPSGTR